MTTSTSRTSVRHSIALFLSLAVLGSPLVVAPAEAGPSKRGHAQKGAKSSAKAKAAPKPAVKATAEPPKPTPAVAATPAPPAALPPPATPPPSFVDSTSSVALVGGTTPSTTSGPPAATETAIAPTPTAVPDAPPPTSLEPPVEPGGPAAPSSVVEHLGTTAYPDQTRGLYGGSLWLEPSFHGLQWPYMPKSGLGLSGYAWADTSYETITRAGPLIPDSKLWVQQARAVLRATPTYANDGFFVQGQLELVGNKGQVRDQADGRSGIVDVDDLWVRVGRWNAWDIKVGRYEGWEVYHTGMGLDINTLERRGATQRGLVPPEAPERPDYYGVTYLHDRPAGQGVGNVALHLFPSSILRFELLGQVGTTDYVANGENTLGARPVGILDLGRIKLKVGGEYVVSKPGNKVVTGGVEEDSKISANRRGAGAALQFVLTRGLEGGVNGGIGLGDAKNELGVAIDTSAITIKSVGGFVNVAPGSLLRSSGLADLLVGLGANWTTQVDLHNVDGRINYTAHLQAFGAVQYLVARRLFVKAVFAYARADFDLAEAGVYSNTMMSGRIRLMYLF